MSSDTAPKYRMGQYDTFRNPEKVRYLQNQVVKAKLESQIDFLKSLGVLLDERIDAISKLLVYVDGKKSKRELLTIESRVSNLYFRTYAGLFDKKYIFDSRRGGGNSMSNRYASDVINGLLNYGYSVLAAEIAKFVYGLGLDPYYGFYHEEDTSFQALVYDLIEPFRWFVESAVYQIASDSNRNYLIKKSAYAWTREGRIILSTELIKRYLEMLERVFRSERLYKFQHGLKRDDGLSMCQEITIAKIHVQDLAKWCIPTTKIFNRTKL